MRKLIVLMVMLFCMMCGSAWGISTEKSGLIYYPTDGASLIAIHNAVVSRGLPAHYKLTHSGSGVSTPYILTSGVTFEDYETLEFEDRARLNISPSATVTYLSSDIDAPLADIIDGDGDFIAPNVAEFYADWFGLNDGGIIDDSGSIQAAIDSESATIIVSPGLYGMESGLTMDNDYQILIANDVELIAINSGTTIDAMIHVTATQVQVFGKLTIEGNDSVGTVDLGIHFDGSGSGSATLSTASNIRVREVYEAGIKVNNTFGVTLDTCYFNGLNDCNGVYVDTVTSTILQNIQGFSNPTEALIKISDGDGVSIKGGAADKCDYGIEITASSGVDIAGFETEGTVKPIKIASSFVTWNGGRIWSAGYDAVSAPNPPASKIGQYAIELTAGRLVMSGVHNNLDNDAVEEAIKINDDFNSIFICSGMQYPSSGSGFTNLPIAVGTGNRIVDLDTAYELSMSNSADQLIGVGIGTTIDFDTIIYDTKVAYNGGVTKTMSELFSTSGATTGTLINYKLPIQGVYEMHIEGRIETVRDSEFRVRIYNDTDNVYVMDRYIYPIFYDPNDDGTGEDGGYTTFSCTYVGYHDKSDLIRFNMVSEPVARSLVGGTEAIQAWIKLRSIGDPL